MVMPEHICPYGLKARYLLRRGGYAINDQWLTTRAETDAFKGKHDVETTPQIFIDGKPIGGYDDFRRLFGLHVAVRGATSYTPVIWVFVAVPIMALGKLGLWQLGRSGLARVAHPIQHMHPGFVKAPGRR